ncbi:lantibiotic dehydratase [Streptosporangiaceae bacterium NEAU-GS5]|nr:lantibiotic dehydratase [Streptosporangiaceae bacterium NEAU-GS5]
MLPSGVKVASPAVIRVAGLPFRVLERLRFESSFALVWAIACRRDRLAADGGALSAELREVIGAAPVEARQALAGLRRAVFHSRPPTGREWNAQVAGALPTALASRVAAWVSALDDCVSLSAALPVVLAAEAARKRSVLREVAAQPAFRRALAHSSPALSGETARWLAEEAHSPCRQSLVRLSRHVAVAAAKTSPRGAFTVTASGAWSAQVEPEEAALELNPMMIHLLHTALCEDARLGPRLPLRLNPSATLVDGGVRFLGPRREDATITIPASLAVRNVLRILADGAYYPMDDLRAMLGGTGDARIGRFLGMLTAAGLLQRHIPVPDPSPDPLGELADWLTANAGDDFAGLAALFARLRSRQRPAGDANARPPALGDAVNELSAARWRPALEDLDTVRRMLAALDLALPLRVALGAYCAERFGPGSRAPFLVLNRTLAEDLSRDPRYHSNAVREMGRFLEPGVEQTPGGGGRLARLRELDRIRAELRDVMAEPDVVNGVVHVDPAAIAKLSASWPDWVTAPPAVAWRLQLIRDGEDARLVVNSACRVHGKGVAGPTADPYADDLEVAHDPKTGLAVLVVQDEGPELRPARIGALADVLLPSPARLLARAFAAAYLAHPGTPVLMSFGPLETPAAVVAQPRVEVGRVVVRRARWTAPLEQVPVRGDGQSDAGYLFRVVAWLRQNAIPMRCFVRVLAPDSHPWGKSRKPMYVDFANWFLVAAFERALTGAGPIVIFEEVLPGPRDAFGADPHATEFVVELSEPGA